jgi:DNA polymerase I
MSKGFLLIDGNNVGNAANAMRPMSVGEQPTQAVFGFLRSIRPSVALYSDLLTPIVLWDGRSWRYDAYPEYKAARTKVSVTANDYKVEKARADYNKQVPLIKEGLKLLGIRQMYSNNMEADDLAGILIERYQGTRRMVMISGDKDWLQLVGPGVAWVDPIRDTRVTTKNFQEKMGVADATAWLDVKCMMGDTSDNIPGVGGIGEAGAKHIVNTYGSVASFTNRIMSKEIKVEELDKKYRDFALEEDRQIAFVRNRILMDLRCKNRPKPEAMTLTYEPFNNAGFKDFCQRYLFQSILRNYDNWIEIFEKENEHGKTKVN